MLAQPLFFVVRLLPGPFVDDASSGRWRSAASPRSCCSSLAMRALARAYRRRGGGRRGLAAPRRARLPQHVRPLPGAPDDRGGARVPARTASARRMSLARARSRRRRSIPLVLLPLALIESWERGGRDAVRRALAWFGGVLVLVHLPFAIIGPGGLRFSYWVQLKRGLEVESLGGGVLLVLDRLGIHSRHAPRRGARLARRGRHARERGRGRLVARRRRRGALRRVALPARPPRPAPRLPRRP